MNKEITELAQALSNVNINSDTAARIAEAYIQYKYIELFALTGTIGLLLLGAMGAIVYLIRKGDL